MARRIVSITLLLWFLILIFAIFVAKDPQVAIYPLFGLYPGSISGQSYSPILVDVWQTIVAVILLVLAVVGLFRNNRPAALACMIVFLLSCAAAFVRLFFEVGPMQ